jgi:serine/threonine-protein kinase mTOR
MHNYVYISNLATVLTLNAHCSLLHCLQVSRALGHMARSSVVPNADYVEFEVNRGLEWLSAEQWHRRVAACLVLRELALNAPTTFYVKARDFFDRIMPLLGDSREVVRQTATEALSTCLAVLAQRRSRHHLNWYCR